MVSDVAGKLLPLKSRSRLVKACSSNNNDQDLIEVKVGEVRVGASSSIIFLKLLHSESREPRAELVLPVHIGEGESSALTKEISKVKGARPLTHDLFKHVMQYAGIRVTKVCINKIVDSTYYSRVHIARADSEGTFFDEVDLDCRPSDAINLALRFQAPMYITQAVATQAVEKEATDVISAHDESHGEIVRTVKELANKFEEPTIMLQLQQELAVKHEKYEEAQAYKEAIFVEMTHNIMARLIVAMECALADGRFQDAAKARDEYRKLAQQQQQQGTMLGLDNGASADQSGGGNGDNARKFNI